MKTFKDVENLLSSFYPEMGLFVQYSPAYRVIGMKQGTAYYPLTRVFCKSDICRDLISGAVRALKRRKKFLKEIDKTFSAIRVKKLPKTKVKK